MRECIVNVQSLDDEAILDAIMAIKLPNEQLIWKGNDTDSNLTPVGNLSQALRGAIV